VRGSTASPPPFELDPVELDRVRRAAANGETQVVNDWADKQVGSFFGLPRGTKGVVEANEVVGEVLDTAEAVNLARHHRHRELAELLQSRYMESDGVSPARAQARRAKVDRIWAAVDAAMGGNLTRPPNEPDWARPDQPVEARMEIFFRGRWLLRMAGGHYVCEATPDMLVMRGRAGQVRVPRSRIASVVWLLNGSHGICRFVFKDAKGKPLGCWDVWGGTQSRKVRRWLKDLGWDPPKITGREALDEDKQLPLFTRF
jgi:hypothetical protein